MLHVGDVAVPPGVKLCFVCEATQLVRFKPCDHTVVCMDCAARVKKCPNCKVGTPIELHQFDLHFIRSVL